MGAGKLILNGDRVSVEENEKVLVVDGGVQMASQQCE